LGEINYIIVRFPEYDIFADNVVAKLPHARIAYTSGGKTDELTSGFSDTDYQC